MEEISYILRKISIKADVFFSGKLCGIQSLSDNEHGHLHLLKGGQLTILARDNRKITLTEPAVIFMPGPLEHRIVSDQSVGAQLVCASLALESTNNALLFQALPDIITFPLSAEKNIGRAADWLFDEAFTKSLARQVMVDKLSELLLLQVLRYVIENNLAKGGVLAALTHPLITKVLNEVHKSPSEPWTVESMADIAAMSRSKFASTFKSVVGTTPNEYVTDIRLEMAKEMLKDKKPVSLIATAVGYEHGSALARVFRKKLGISPREWLSSTLN